MRIQHNITAMIANRFFRNNGCLLKRGTEKLSTGYRVNRAADAAAGLTISEKMRGQIRGLNQASNNIQDGISLIQTAEGALQETHSVLQRMRELSVQAANDTYVLADREAIQEEMDQLTAEVDRIAEHTEYNNGIYPLLGGERNTNNVLNKYLAEITYTFTAQNTFTLDDVTYKPGDSVTVTGVMVNNALNGQSLMELFLFDDRFIIPTQYTSEWLREYTIQQYDTPNHIGFSVKIKDFGIDDESFLYYRRYNRWSNSWYNSYIALTAGAGIGLCGKDHPAALKTNPDSTNSTSAIVSNLWIQAGANANQGINISLVDATAAGIGLNDVSVLSSAEAGKAIQTVDDAISQVSRYRSDFGAQQNRLEHAMAVDDNTAENLQAAESRIRDLDMADEIVSNAKLTILEQFMQTILANANSQPESVLALLS